MTSLPHECTEEEDYREIQGGRGPLLSRGEEKARLHYQGREEKREKEEEGLNFSKKNYKYLLPNGPVLHLQVG